MYYLQKFKPTPRSGLGRFDLVPEEVLSGVAVMFGEL